MNAHIVATSVRLIIDFSQRELELFHALMGHITGFKGEEISGVKNSASEFTDLARTLHEATQEQVRSVESRER